MAEPRRSTARSMSNVTHQARPSLFFLLILLQLGSGSWRVRARERRSERWQKPCCVGFWFYRLQLRLSDRPESMAGKNDYFRNWFMVDAFVFRRSLSARAHSVQSNVIFLSLFGRIAARTRRVETNAIGEYVYVRLCVCVSVHGHVVRSFISIFFELWREKIEKHFYFIGNRFVWFLLLLLLLSSFSLRLPGFFRKSIRQRIIIFHVLLFVLRLESTMYDAIHALAHTQTSRTYCIGQISDWELTPQWLDAENWNSDNFFFLAVLHFRVR